MTTPIYKYRTWLLTEDECKRARCGQIAGDGCRYPRHSGNQGLARVDGGKRAECQGCGRFYAASEVRALLAAKVG